MHSIGQEWKHRKQTRQRMESSIETSDLKLSGGLVQTSKNCDAEYGRTFNSTAADLDKHWHETGRSCGCVFWWKPGYCFLLSYVTLLLDGWPVFCFLSSARVNWCSCASVVIFSNSVVINSLSSFSVPFSVISMLRGARCMSLLSVGVVE